MKRLYSARAFRMLFLLVSLTLIGGVSSAWAQTVTFEPSSFTDLTATYKEYTATVDGITLVVNQGYKNGGIQLNSGKGDAILYNSTPIENLKSVEITMTTVGSGGYTLTSGTAQKPTGNAKSSSEKTINYVVNDGDTYFQFKVVKGAHVITKIVINCGNSDGETEEPEIPEPTPITAETVYKKITSATELTNGGTFIIVYDEGKKAMGTLSNSHGTARDITFVADNICIESEEDANMEISIEPISGGYTLETAKGFIGFNSSTNFAGYTSSVGTNDKYKWTITFEDGDVKILNVGDKTRYIGWGGSDFRPYSTTSSTGLPIQLYRKVGVVTAAETVENHATFYANYAYVMPDGVTGYAVTANAAEGTLTKTEAYAAGDEVPAATPLLLEAKEAGTFYPVVLNKTIDAYEGENYLEGGRDENGMTKSVNDGSVLYYKLAVGDSGAGFYWGAADGAAFAMTKPTTAYLAVPTPVANAVRGFAFADSSVTGIGHAAAAVADEAVYTLSGVRVSAAKSELPAGIYVVNGKKLMVK